MADAEPASPDADTEPFGERRVRDHVVRLARLPELHRQLRMAAGAAAMLAQAADLVRSECGFARALVLTVADNDLTAAGTHALEDPASDRLRRRIQGTPLRLVSGTVEYRLIRGRRSGARGTASRSPLAEVLGLDHHAYGVISPEADPLALLVVDRAEPLDALDRVIVANVAAMIGTALEHLVLRGRMAEVSLELRGMTSSAQALMSEVLHAPLTIPIERGQHTAFPRSGIAASAARGSVRELLTDRELAVAGLLVQGRSNREIATELIIAPSTVKDCVLRIRRKLQATNRVDAAARYLQLTQADHG